MSGYDTWPLERFLSQPFFVAEVFTGSPGVAGRNEGLPDDSVWSARRPASFMVGNIDEAIAKPESSKAKG